jgi:hypothetical protein
MGVSMVIDSHDAICDQLMHLIESTSLEDAAMMPHKADETIAAQLAQEAPGSEYLTSYGIDPFWCHNAFSDERQEMWEDQRRRLGFDERQTWSLDLTLLGLIFERMIMFLPLQEDALDVDAIKDGEPRNTITIHGVTKPVSFWTHMLSELIRTRLMETILLDNLKAKVDKAEDDMMLQVHANSTGGNIVEVAVDSSAFALQAAYYDVLDGIIFDILRAVFPHLWW